jgi:ABC-type dipeptide/oligopeptide/nickel transport system permease component
VLYVPLVVGYLSRRLAWAALLLVAITLVVFLVVHLSGDPTALYVGPEGTQKDYEIVRAALGFDRPLAEQYGRFLSRALRGDFGRSLRHQQPTLPLVLTRVPATLELALVAMALAVVLALPLGIVSALRRNSVLDTIAMTFALSGQCMPTFWLGILLILVFAVQLRWVPVYGGEGLATLVLPAVTLGVWAMARTARITRSSMLEVLHQDFLRTARAKGVSEWGVVVRHALRNGAIPIVTAIGLELGNLLGGAVITEAVFAYPGVGRLAVEAVVNKDVPLLQAVVVTVAATLLLLNAIIDVLYMALDPRVRLA